jgi:hypothetical protein
MKTGVLDARLTNVCLRSVVGSVHDGAMDEAFIIMQIGSPELDAVCDNVIMPAIADAGLEARRVDRHNEGDLLKSEIVQFIERSQIIVADLTNERPNCYLEVGYAMGLGKKANLILTCREDHHHSSPNFVHGAANIHFDLEGYDILLWDPADLGVFRSTLTHRIRRRAAIVQGGRRPAAGQVVDLASWRDPLRARAEAGLAGIERSASMEITATIEPFGNWTQNRLLAAVRDAEVHTFGWPIAVTLENREFERPRPTSDGIEAEIPIGEVAAAGPIGRRSYDLWKVFRDGRFYTLLSLFEDELGENVLFWDMRINRVTEALFFLVRLYRRLEASDTDIVTVEIRHAGLAGRTMGVANGGRFLPRGHSTTEDVVATSVSASLVHLETDLPAYVKQIVDPLFTVFDFFEVAEEIVTEIAEGFMRGDVR